MKILTVLTAGIFASTSMVFANGFTTPPATPNIMICPSAPRITTVNMVNMGTGMWNDNDDFIDLDENRGNIQPFIWNLLGYDEVESVSSADIAPAAVVEQTTDAVLIGDFNNLNIGNQENQNRRANQLDNDESMKQPVKRRRLS